MIDRSGGSISSHDSIYALSIDLNDVKIAPQAIFVLSKSPSECIEVKFNFIGEGAEACAKDAQKKIINIVLQTVNATTIVLEGNIKHDDLFVR